MTPLPSEAEMPAIVEPAPAELERALKLFGHARFHPQARLLAAARSRPIFRFIAAAAWWPAGRDVLFQLACQPGVDRPFVCGLLIDRLTEGARLAGVEKIQFAHLLTEDNEWFGILRSLGFASLRSERSFAVALQHAWTRIMEIHQKHGARIPASWKARPIRDVSPETALAVIDSHRLLTPAEVRAFWSDGPRGGFSLDYSCVLFDRDRAFGAFLARRMGDVHYIDVQVVQEKNPILRSLADFYMMYEMLRLHDIALKAGTDTVVRWLKFRSGQIEHRQTANLALRMGGRELPPCHVLAKPL